MTKTHPNPFRGCGLNLLRNIAHTAQTCSGSGHNTLKIDYQVQNDNVPKANPAYARSNM